MKRFVEDDLGLPFRFDAMMSPRIDCSQSPLATRLTPSEIVELDMRDPRRVGDWQKFSDYFLAPPRPSTEENLYQCGGGLNSFTVDPFGQMAICGFSQRDQYALKDGSVSDGWEGFLKGIRGKKTTRVTKCTACHLKAACGMCPANAELETGDPEEPVDFLCHVAHLRAALFEWTVPAHGDCEYCAGGKNHDRLTGDTEALRERLNSGSEPAFKQMTLLPSLVPAQGSQGLPMAMPDACGTSGIPLPSRY
jgi:radical SAM protein with 4Fe4S-binding SPASM domain